MTDRNMLWKWFGSIDVDKSGKLDVFELQKALQLGGLNFSLKTVQALMRLHDRDHGGTIDFREFEKLHHWLFSVMQAFTQFDQDRSGALDKNEVLQALQRAGYQLERPAFEALFSSYDPDRSNNLCQAEFVAMTVFLQGASATFRAFDAGNTGRVNLDFSQFVYACSNAN